MVRADSPAGASLPALPTSCWRQVVRLQVASLQADLAAAESRAAHQAEVEQAQHAAAERRAAELAGRVTALEAELLQQFESLASRERQLQVCLLGWSDKA